MMTHLSVKGKIPTLRFLTSGESEWADVDKNSWYYENSQY